MGEFRNILIIHNGALGDFLCGWPGILSVLHHFEKMPQKTEKRWFVGREINLHWLKPLGFTRPDSSILNAVDRLYVSSKWPEALNDTLVFWFCLKKPSIELENENLVLLPILDFPLANRPGISAKIPRVMQNLIMILQDLGIVWEEKWQETWHDLFGCWYGQESKQVALIPGAGHVAKQWPLESFEQLSRLLDDAGYDPVYLLGPVEKERGLLPVQARSEFPTPPWELAARLMQMRAVVACDAGPAHLASIHSVPGLVLFGPTSPQTWAPSGLKVVQPLKNTLFDINALVDDPKDIKSNMPSSMNLITPGQVFKKLLKELA